MMQKILIAVAFVAGIVPLAQALEEYREPDSALTARVDAPMQPASPVSPDKRRVAACEWKRVVSQEWLARHLGDQRGKQ